MRSLITPHELKSLRKMDVPVVDRPLSDIRVEDLKRGDLSKLSRKYDVPVATAYARIFRSDWSIEETFSTPIMDPTDSGKMGWERNPLYQKKYSGEAPPPHLI